MEEPFNHIVYSKNVIEFVTVANEYCSFIENFQDESKEEYLTKMQKIIPLLYLKASLIPPLESLLEEVNEKFVTEADWFRMHDRIKALLGLANEYMEVFDDRIENEDNHTIASLAENFADIYQDMKNFLMLYRLGTTEIMNDALWECMQNFEQFWGQKAVNSLRAIHHIIYNPELFENKDDQNEDSDQDHIDTSNWFITQRQKDARDDNEFV
ncbi:DUF5063 domain-containing protein [Bacteroidota bacterium]